jgi:inorganic pyrophosphatase
MENVDSSVFLRLGASIMEESDPEFTMDVFIEISKNSHIKYEYDKERKALICDRILHTPFQYQFNYGFIPNTLSEDCDPIDVVVIMEDELIPGSYINCKLLGYLETKDDSGVDPKLIMCPSKKIDPTYSFYRNIFDINSYTREKIKYFFSHYKDLENKKVEIGTFKNKHEAIEVYNESVKRFNLLKPISPVTSMDSLVYSLSQSSNNQPQDIINENSQKCDCNLNRGISNEVRNPLNEVRIRSNEVKNHSNEVKNHSNEKKEEDSVYNYCCCKNIL